MPAQPEIDAQTPDFWVVELAEIDRHLESFEQWEVREICRSAGGYSVWACMFGPKKEIERTANFSAAYHSAYPEAFWGREVEQQCFMYVAGVHGAEMEGPMAAVNFMHVIENGRDLRGREWPRIQEVADGLRLVVLPVLNPDGRARVEPRSLVGGTLDDVRYWGQGRWKSGENIGYPDCKRHQPLPMAEVEFAGGYPNDDGYNLMHDCTPGDIRTNEVRALMELALEEVPDCVVNSHSYQLSPGVIAYSTVLDGYAERQREMSAAIGGALEERDLRPRDYFERSGYNLVGALHLACGALAVTFEGPHGVQENPYTHEQILDCHLSSIEGALTFGADRGFRPPRR
jgi:hypothetical protein